MVRIFILRRVRRRDDDDDAGTKNAVRLLNQSNGDCLRAIVMNVDDCYPSAAGNRAETRIHLSQDEMDEADVRGWEVVRDLDMWWRTIYVSTVRHRGHLTKNDLVKIMEWKISHSKWRPLLKGIKTNKDGLVKSCTKEAFDAMRTYDGTNPDALQSAIDALGKLKYVGPVTATAILAPVYPQHVAYACDEALEALGFKRTVRSSKQLMLFLTKAKEVATSYGVTPLDLSDALWTVAWSSTYEDTIDTVNEWLAWAVDFAGGYRDQFAHFNANCRSRPGFKI